MFIEKTEVFGWAAALRGMRNPMNSWDKSDSSFYTSEARDWRGILVPENPIVGSADLRLATSLVKAGSEHAKFTRQIVVWFDMAIPRYLHQEFDTYRVGSTKSSCSTRPSVLKKIAFTMDMFETDDIEEEDKAVMLLVIERMNHLARKYAETKDTVFARRIKKLLMESFLQKATYSMNYQNLRAMHKQRMKHWLPEWSGCKNSICSWIESLPYASELITIGP